MALGTSLPAKLPEPSGSIFYIDPVSGNDSTGTGSSAGPWKTLEKGRQALGPGVTLRLRSGELGVANGNATPNNFTADGISTNPWLIEPDTGHTPVIRGTFKLENATWFKIRNLTFRGPAAGAGGSTLGDTLFTMRPGCANGDIEGCRITESGFSNGGLYATSLGNRVWVDRCRIDRNGTTIPTEHEGIYIESVNAGATLYLTNGVTDRNVAWGIQLYPNIAGTIYVVGWTSCFNGRAGFLWNNNGAGLAPSIFWYGNVAYGNGTYGYEMNAAPTVPTACERRECVAFNNASGATSIDAGLGCVQSGNVTTDPLFVAPASDNYHLQSGSSSASNIITSATTKPWCPGYDFDNQARAEPADGGAFEITAGAGGGTGSFTQRGGATSATADHASTSIVVNKPTGTVSGDILVAVVSNQNGLNRQLDPPDGTWTLFTSTNVAPDTNEEIAAYWKVAGGSEPLSYTWNLSGGTGQALAIILTAWTGQHATPTDASAGAADSTSDTTAVGPSITTGADNALVFWGYATRATNTVSVPAGYTTQAQVNNPAGSFKVALAVGTQVKATAGSTGAQNGSLSSSNTGVGIQFSIKPAAAPATSGKVGQKRSADAFPGGGTYGAALATATWTGTGGGTWGNVSNATDAP